MYCKNCGKEVLDDACFCKYCGTKFIEKEVRDGKTIVKTVEEKKNMKNKNAIISIIFAVIAIIGCLLPLSYGWIVIVGVVVFIILSLFFRLRGKNEMYKLYNQEGRLVGKRLIDASLVISSICLILALGSIPRFF